MSEAKEFVEVWAEAAEAVAKVGTTANNDRELAQTKQISPKKVDPQPIRAKHAKPEGSMTYRELMTGFALAGYKMLTQKIFHVIGTLVIFCMIYLLHLTLDELRLITHENVMLNRQQMRLLEEILVILRSERNRVSS